MGERKYTSSYLNLLLNGELLASSSGHYLQKNNPRHVLSRRLVSPQIRYRCFEEDIYKLLLLGMN
jgi:hypothetical protein